MLKCFAGCKTEAIVAALQLKLSDLFVSTAGGSVSAPQRRTVAYPYTDEEGRELSQARRYEPGFNGEKKAFRQFRREGERWVAGLGNTRRVLYQLPRVIKAIEAGGIVLVVEGEKDVHSLLDHLKVVATTNPGGAGKWRSAYSESLRGGNIAILPDNDEPGRAHAHQVANALLGIAKTVRVVELPGLAVKGDVTDWLSQGGTKEQLQQIVRAAPVLKSSDRRGYDRGVATATES